MKSEISKWNQTTKIITNIAIAIYFIVEIFYVFTGRHIPGISSISLGIGGFGIGLELLNSFNEDKKKIRLIIVTILVIGFIFSLYKGITEVQNYIFIK